MTASRFVAIVGAVIITLSLASPANAVVVLAEDFDDASAFTKADEAGTAATFFASAPNVYWGIYDPGAGPGDFGGDAEPTGVPAYDTLGATPFVGNFLVGEQLTGLAGTNDVPMRLDWSDLDVTDLASVTFSGLFGASTVGAFESGGANPDFIRIQFRFDSDAFIDVFQFIPDSDAEGAKELALDFDNDNVVDGATLSLTPQSFSKSVAVPTGKTMLDLRILMTSTMAAAGTPAEEIAFDSLMIDGVAIPEASAFLFGGLVCGVIGLSFASRRLFGLKTEQDQA
jgi:hypothetical protein